MDYMAIDQYGHTYHGLGKHPRKVLLERLDAKGASRMYQDKLSGPPVHVGYVIKGLWLVLYKVEPYEGKA